METNYMFLTVIYFNPITFRGITFRGKNVQYLWGQVWQRLRAENPNRLLESYLYIVQAGFNEMYCS
jgi:hypothetical protein